MRMVFKMKDRDTHANGSELVSTWRASVFCSVRVSLRIPFGGWDPFCVSVLNSLLMFVRSASRVGRRLVVLWLLITVVLAAMSSAPMSVSTC